MNFSRLASRRRFLLTLSGCVAVMVSPVHSLAASGAGVASVSAHQVQAFREVCNTLAGTAVSDNTLARQYLVVLVEHLERSQIKALLALAKLPVGTQSAASLKKPLREVVEFALQLWMSGMVGSDRVLAYVDAPVWSVLSFTKPAGVCGGAFGYWANAPS